MLKWTIKYNNNEGKIERMFNKNDEFNFINENSILMIKKLGNR
jgi:hypothetical protein